MSRVDTKWQIENDVRTLKGAEAIKQDKERMKLVKVQTDKEIKALSATKKDIAKNYAGEMNKSGAIMG